MTLCTHSSVESIFFILSIFTVDIFMQVVRIYKRNLGGGGVEEIRLSIDVYVDITNIFLGMKAVTIKYY